VGELLDVYLEPAMVRRILILYLITLFHLLTLILFVLGFPFTLSLLILLIPLLPVLFFAYFLPFISLLDILFASLPIPIALFQNPHKTRPPSLRLYFHPVK
jgi:hypothetical protein